MISRKRTPKNKIALIQKLIKKVDVKDLKGDFDHWPELASKSWRGLEGGGSRYSGVDSIIFAGMGGSGITGSLLFDYASETKSNKRFSCINDYHLPSSIDKSALVIGMSCSGSTEETLSILSEAHSRGLSAACFGSGGPLEEYSAKWGYDFTKTLMLQVPRSSLPGLFFAVLRFCKNHNLLEVEEQGVEEAITSMKLVRDIDLHSQSSPASFALQLFQAHSATPVIYSSMRCRAVGLRFRQSLNENAKLHAFDGVIPEACHNDVVGWDEPRRGKRSRKGTGVAVMLSLPDDPPEISVRFNVMESIARASGAEVLNSPSFGKSYLSRVVSSLYFLDYVSYYLAVLRRINPIETPSIDLLKKALSRKLDYASRF